MGEGTPYLTLGTTNICDLSPTMNAGVAYTTSDSGERYPFLTICEIFWEYQDIRKPMLTAWDAVPEDLQTKTDVLPLDKYDNGPVILSHEIQHMLDPKIRDIFAWKPPASGSTDRSTWTQSAPWGTYRTLNCTRLAYYDPQLALLNADNYRITMLAWTLLLEKGYNFLDEPLNLRSQ